MSLILFIQLPILGQEIKESIPDSFQRNVVTEELYVSNYIYDASVDTIAPGRITDVGINNIESETTQSGENRNLTLTWTATGDDKHQGRGIYTLHDHIYFFLLLITGAQKR
jgi:hypothetical protein